MSGGIFCRCEGPLAERRKFWVVWHREHNHSAFNGYKFTVSAYSCVHCTKCNSFWRTYVDELPGYCANRDAS